MGTASGHPSVNGSIPVRENFFKKTFHFFQPNKTVRIEIKGTEFGGTFYYNRTYHVFIQSLGEKNEKPFFVTRNRGNTMGISGHGIFFRLWAVRARSALVVADLP